MDTSMTVIEVPNSGRSYWIEGGYTYFFVYSPEGNFLLKGYWREVKEFADRKFNKYIYKAIIYRKGTSRRIISFAKCPLSIKPPNIKRKSYKYIIEPYYYNDNKNAFKLRLKRLPEKWIAEYDAMINIAQKNTSLDFNLF